LEISDDLFADLLFAGVEPKLVPEWSFATTGISFTPHLLPHPPRSGTQDGRLRA
jgi:hypothetical protein